MSPRSVTSSARPRLGRAISRCLWWGAASSFAPLVVVQAQNAASTGPATGPTPAKVRPQLTLPSPPQSAIALDQRAVSVAVKQKFRQPSLISLPEASQKAVSGGETAAATTAATIAVVSAGASKASPSTNRVAPEVAEPEAAEPEVAEPEAADVSKKPAHRRVETWAPSGGREDSPLLARLSTTSSAPVASTDGLASASSRTAPASLPARPGAAQLPWRGGPVLKPKVVELRPDGIAVEAPNGSVPGASRDLKSREVPAVSASERLMLARLDADLGRAQSRLNRAETRLSEGQKQLGSFTDVLRDAMLDAGDDAHGLHPFVRVAQRYLGTPYVWGGESARGFDCSGFIMRVMRDLGYRALPHSAAEQFRYGLPVAKPLLKPGDVVFFANTYKPGISHVGIYLGHGRFIHAANSRVGTIVSSLNEPKWVEKYAGARRLLPVNS